MSCICISIARMSRGPCRWRSAWTARSNADPWRRPCVRRPPVTRLARAQLTPSRGIDLHYAWLIADQLGDIDLREVSCRDPGELDRAPEALLDRVPSLDRPGPFSLLLAHTADGDVIVLNLHHAAGDSLSALRLLGSIARAYAGEDDPLPLESKPHGRYTHEHQAGFTCLKHQWL
jgi:hypothetical protein